MNDRTLLRTVLVLAVLSLATNVLVLKDLKVSGDASTPPANYYGSYIVHDLNRMLLEIEQMVDQEKELNDTEIDEVLVKVFEMENYLDVTRSSQRIVELERTARELREVVMAGRPKEDIMVVISKFRDLLRRMEYGY